MGYCAKKEEASGVFEETHMHGQHGQDEDQKLNAHGIVWPSYLTNAHPPFPAHESLSQGISLLGGPEIMIHLSAFPVHPTGLGRGTPQCIYPGIMASRPAVT